MSTLFFALHTIVANICVVKQFLAECPTSGPPAEGRLRPGHGPFWIWTCLNMKVASNTWQDLKWMINVGIRGVFRNLKRGVRNLTAREAREHFFRTPRETASHPPLFAPPPYRAVANRISKNFWKKGLFVRKKRLELVWTAYSWLVHCTNVWS